jgi:alpha-1,6-mannosyltransferase
VTLVVGIFGPTANGDRFALFQIVDATLASAVVVLALFLLTYRHLPWRQLPAEPGRPGGEPPPNPTPRPAAVADAYADSP